MAGPASTTATQDLSTAWPLLLAGFVILFVVVGGGIDTVSVFLNALSMSEGWSRRALSVGISVGAVSAGLATPIVGWLVDRHGVRVPILFGTSLLALGFLLLLSMSEPWHFVAANVLLGPGFAATAMLPIPVAITVCVRERTAFALGLVGVGSSAGALILAPAVQALVDALGWRGAYAVMGVAMALTPLPFLLFALPRGPLARPGGAPETGRPRPGLVRDLRRPGVALLAALLIVPGIVTFGINVHLVPLLSDFGHPATFAAGALGAAIGVSALGKLGGGLSGDRLGAVPTLRLALLLKTVAVALLPLAASAPVVVLFVGLHGLALGAEVAVVPLIALAVLGRERFATLFGLLQLGTTLAIGLAPIVPGVIADATGSYAGAMVFWGLSMLVAVLLAFQLRPTLLAAPVSAAVGTS